jgi:hypothetical protein
VYLVFSLHRRQFPLSAPLLIPLNFQTPSLKTCYPISLVHVTTLFSHSNTKLISLIFAIVKINLKIFQYRCPVLNFMKTASNFCSHTGGWTDTSSACVKFIRFVYIIHNDWNELP